LREQPGFKLRVEIQSNGHEFPTACSLLQTLPYREDLLLSTIVHGERVQIDVELRAFHLLLNLREAVEKELARQRRRLALPPVEEDQSVTKTAPMPAPRSRANPEVQTHKRQLVEERWRAKKRLFARVRALHVSGRSASAIVRETGVGRRRVDKWIRCRQLPTRNEMEPKPTSPRFFATHLQRRWAEGCHEGPRLLEEIRALGYCGCYSSLAKFIARCRDLEPESPGVAAASFG
jgi:hypothetical protein